MPAPESRAVAGAEIVSAVVTSATCETAACTNITIRVAASYVLNEETAATGVNLSFIPLFVYGNCLSAGSSANVNTSAGSHSVMVKSEIGFWGQGTYQCPAGTNSISDEIFGIRVYLGSKSVHAFRDFLFYADIFMTR